jgi:hypothetical protein
LKVRQQSQTLDVVQPDMTIAHADQPVSAQARQHAIDVRCAQAEGIGHQLLGERQFKG